MKKTIAVIGSAAALSFAGAGLASAQSDLPGLDGSEGIPGSSEVEGVEGVENAEEVSAVAQQLCGTISAYDFLGSVGGFAQGLAGEDCEANADEAIAAATSGDISGAIDILRGIETEIPDDGENENEEDENGGDPVDD